jgi:hypothetical protein
VKERSAAPSRHGRWPTELTFSTKAFSHPAFLRSRLCASARTARKGDTFLVSKVDRLAGTTPDLFEFSRLDRVGRIDQSAHIRMESVEWNDFGTTPDACARQFIARCGGPAIHALGPTIERRVADEPASTRTN